MKLRNLSGAIRKHKGAVSLTWASPHGLVLIETSKTSLLAALKTGFGDDGMAETGLTLSAKGSLIPDDVPNPMTMHAALLSVREIAAAGQTLEASDDDLLLDDEPAQFAGDWSDDGDLLDDGEDATEDELDDLLG